MLRMEINQVTRRPVFWILILIGLIFAVLPVIQKWPHGMTIDDYIFYPGSPYVFWMYFTGETYYIYTLTFPLLATLVYADAYAEDFNTGLIKSILTKVEKRKYLNTRYLVNFLMGGGVAVLPLIINFLGEMMAFPLIENNYYFGMPLVTQESYLADMFYQSPFIYVLLRIFWIFIFGGMLASLGLAFSTVVKNRYIVLIFPFLIVLALDVLLSTFGWAGLSLHFLGNINSTWQLPSITAIGLIGSYLWYRLLGGKNETI